VASCGWSKGSDRVSNPTQKQSETNFVVERGAELWSYMGILGAHLHGSSTTLWVGPRIDVWAEENAMASLSTERNGQKLFSGDKEGPPLRHLKQMHVAQDVGIKLRPTAANLTPNDRFVLLTDLLEGGARSPGRINSRSGCRRSWTQATQWNWRSTRHPWRCTLCGWQSGTLCPQQVGARLLYPQHRHPRWPEHYIGTRWVNFENCLAVCTLNGPPAALKSTGTLNLCQGSQHPIW
jgi:hypothetical protein